MAKSEIKVHEVELLSVSTAHVDGEPVVVITIRPDEGSFRPHNLAVARSQAERLLEDLKRLLTLTPLLLLFMTGCSGRVDVTTESRTPTETSETVEKLHTSLGIDVLTDRKETSKSRHEVQPALPVRSVEIDGDGNVVIVIEGDVHEHPQQNAATNKRKSGWNTKIGWPTQLRGTSSWTVGSYLAVWGLVVAAIALMIDNLQRKEGGPLLSVVAMLGTAAVLLQFMPHADSGAQLIPLSPWDYAGWESFFVSLVCWAAVLGATFVAIDRAPDKAQAFAVLGLVALFLSVLLSWSDLKEDSALRSQCSHMTSTFLLLFYVVVSPRPMSEVDPTPPTP